MKDKQFRKSYLATVVYTALNAGGLIISMSYISYIYTDLAHVELGKMSLGLSIASIAGLVLSLFWGVLIQKTRSRMGQFRPWILGCGIAAIVGTLMTLWNYKDPVIAFVLITLGYTLASSSADAQATAQFGLLERFSGGDNDKRNSIMAASMLGSNAGYLIFAAALLPIVGMFSAKGELTGFRNAEIFIGACVLVGLLVIVAYGKRYDPNNIKGITDDMGSVPVKVLFASLFKNRLLLVVTIAEIFKYVGYSLFTYLMVYQCTYTLGSLDLMTFTLTGMSLICAVAALIAPWFVKLFKGRKKAYIAAQIGCVISYTIMAFIGNTIVGFLIPFVFANIFEGIYLAMVINLYLDAGEWWYDKKGEDTRTFAMSIQAIGAKIAMTISGAVLAMVLVACEYDDAIGEFGEAIGITTEHGMLMCTRLTGLLPAAGALIAVLIMVLFHHVSDKEIEACIEKNAEKDAALYGEIAE